MVADVSEDDRFMVVCFVAGYSSVDCGWFMALVSGGRV